VNPWDRSRTTGASSVAVAVAVATGMSPLGLGNDGLGSLRHPAQCCGISVLKPGLGRIPEASTVAGAQAGAIGAQLVTVNGPLARRAADLQAAFEVIAGYTWRDPPSGPAPLRGPGPRKPIRVALVADPAGQGTARQVQQAVRAAGRALENVGYVAEELEPPSIELAARTCLDMLNTPDIRAMWQMTACMLPAGTQQFLEQFYAEPTTLTRPQPCRPSRPGTGCCKPGPVPADASADHRPDLHRAPLPSGHRPEREPRRG
jgi:amidase